MAKAKGSTLIGAVAELRRNKAKAREILPEKLHHYLETRVSPASWYPEEDLLQLIRALLEITPGSRSEALDGMGRATARAFSEGVYSHLLGGKGSTTTTFALWSTMHDSGTLKSHKDRESRSVAFELRDFGLPSPEMCAITKAFIEEALRLAGGTAQLAKDRCVLSGDDCCRWTTG